MRVRRLRWLIAALFAFLMGAIAVAPLLLWQAEREDAVRRRFEDALVAQMGDVLHGETIGQRPDDDVPTWFVNVNDGWVDPFVDTDLEPPLFTWVRESGEQPSFRSYSLDGADSYLAYIRPKVEGQGWVTLADTSERDGELDRLSRTTWLLTGGLLAACLLFGWLLSGLALDPVKRVLADQQGFLADAAHEMRTPLAVIMASSSQALSRSRSSEEYVRSLSEIRSAAERASTGVNEMLDLVRFESGQMMPRVAPLRLDLLAEEVAAAVRADDSEIRAELGDSVVVDADMALLRQALENIVRNAARRAPHVILRTRVEGRDGVVEVSDDGPGFDPATLGRVFERYQRGDRRGEAGIGLAIVRAIAVAHGGSATAGNGEAGGAVVSLRVPLSRSVYQ
ncbi:MAG: HAMP domain-containing sensor histidine kinase [Ilumatobacteraceae bacterium]